jgi:hypothetical protein
LNVITSLLLPHDGNLFYSCFDKGLSIGIVVFMVLVILLLEVSHLISSVIVLTKILDWSNLASIDYRWPIIVGGYSIYSSVILWLFSKRILRNLDWLHWLVSQQYLFFIFIFLHFYFILNFYFLDFYSIRLYLYFFLFAIIHKNRPRFLLVCLPSIHHTLNPEAISLLRSLPRSLFLNLFFSNWHLYLFVIGGVSCISLFYTIVLYFLLFKLRTGVHVLILRCMYYLQIFQRQTFFDRSCISLAFGLYLHLSFLGEPWFAMSSLFDSLGLFVLPLIRNNNLFIHNKFNIFKE